MTARVVGALETAGLDDVAWAGARRCAAVAGWAERRSRGGADRAMARRHAVVVGAVDAVAAAGAWSAERSCDEGAAVTLATVKPPTLFPVTWPAAVSPTKV